jgi:hypothetical protein
MKSKIVILILIVLLISSYLTGCKSTGIKVPDQSIPFLILTTDSKEGVKKAVLNFWDLKSGKIIKTNNIVYTLIPTTDLKSAQEMYETRNDDKPLYWDGEECLILPWFMKVNKKLYKRTEATGETKGPSEWNIFGKDVNMLVERPANNPTDNKYTVKLWNGEKYIEKELNLNYKSQDLNSKPIYPVAIGNEERNLNILFCGDFNPQTGLDLFVCSVDKKDWTHKWTKVSVKEDADIGPSNPPNFLNTVYFDRSFYIPSGCCGIAKVDLDDYTCEKWKDIKPFKPSEEDIAYYTSILGNFKDTLIIRFVIGRVSGGEHYIIAFKEGETIGMIHISNSNLQVMDKNGNVLSNLSLDGNPGFVFPKLNGGM